MRATRVVVVGGLIAVAACSDSPTNQKDVTGPEANPAIQQSELAPVSVHRIMDLRPSVPVDDNTVNDAKQNAPTANTGIYYHNGKILNTPKVYAIYWASSPIYSNGPSVGNTYLSGADPSLVGYFMSHLGEVGQTGNSGYWGINYTYSGYTYTGTTTVPVGSITYAGYWATSHSAPASGSKPGDADMQALLDYGFANANLPYDPQGIYAIFTGPGVNLGGGFGSQYCAYHYWYTSTSAVASGKVVKYAAMPYNADFPSGCVALSGSPNSDPAADAEVNTLAHELEEAATDAEGTAWYDRRGYENADKCAWKFGTTQTTNGAKWNITVGGKNFLVQQNWKNSGSGGCYLQ